MWMRVQTDSETTSASPRVLMPPIFHRGDARSEEFRVRPAIIAVLQPQAINMVQSGVELSANRKRFNATVVVAGQSKISVVDARRESSSFFIYDVDNPASTERFTQSNLVVLSSRASRSNESWEVWSGFDLEASRSLCELRSLVSAIGLKPAPKRSVEFEQLLERALAVQGDPKDIEQWAQGLARDVSNLDD